MSLWGSLLNVGGAVVQSSAAQTLLSAGVDAGVNKLFDNDGFSDPQSQSPTAPLAAPKPAPINEQEKQKLPVWAIPAGIGGGVLLLFFLFGRKRGK